MARQLTLQDHYNNGHASYPNKRIMYPDNCGAEEDAWLQGYNAAQYESEMAIANTGVFTWMSDYQYG